MGFERFYYAELPLRLNIQVYAGTPGSVLGVPAIPLARTRGYVDTGAITTTVDKEFITQYVGSQSIGDADLVTPGMPDDSAIIIAEVHKLEITLEGRDGNVTRTIDALVTQFGLAFQDPGTVQERANVILGMDFLQTCNFSYTLRPNGALLVITDP